MTSESYESLRTEGYVLAGGLADLRQRASVYHHMYADSGKRNVFPLIAAHGALWASGYFKKGMLGGRILSLAYLLAPRVRGEKLRAVADFANKFRDINRKVCAESYAIYHYTKRHGGNDFIRSVIGDDFADILCACHRSNDTNTEFSKEMREQLFIAFFNWEQENIVGPDVTEAFANVDWGVIKYLALRPRIAFAYFGKGFHLQFENFSSLEERVRRGLQAYRRAEEVGLAHVENSVSLDNLLAGFPEQRHQALDGYCRNSECKSS